VSPEDALKRIGVTVQHPDVVAFAERTMTVARDVLDAGAHFPADPAEDSIAAEDARHPVHQLIWSAVRPHTPAEVMQLVTACPALWSQQQFGEGGLVDIAGYCLEGIVFELVLIVADAEYLLDRRWRSICIASEARAASSNATGSADGDRG
jgi:hypothetical protein